MAKAALVGLDPEKMLATRSNLDLELRKQVVQRVDELRARERDELAIAIRNNIAKMLNGDTSA